MTHDNTGSGTGILYGNGTAASPTVTQNTGTGTDVYIGARFGTPPANPWNGYVAEVIIYKDNVLSTTQRQQVEGYLAWKWGLQNNLPSDHPYRTNYSIVYSNPNLPFPRLLFPRFFSSRAWLPTSVSDLNLWFDAADTSTITGTTQVTAWASKGSTSTNIVNNTGSATSGSARQNGLNYINIPGGVSLQFTAALNSTSNRTWIWMIRNRTQLGVTFPTNQLTLTSGASGQDDTGLSQSPANVYEIANVPSGFTGNFLRASIGNPLNNINIYSIVRSTDTTLQLIAENGANLTLVENNAAGNFNASNQTYNVSLANRNSEYDCFEILYFNRTLSTLERQSIEGYLAWKWGIPSSLPEIHPFKRFPPPPI